MITKGYSLWLSLPEDIKNIYQRIIVDLSKKYSFPVFEPHITLLGEVEGSEEELIKNSEQLMSHFSRIQVETNGLQTEDFFFRALYVQIKKTTDLLNLHEKAKDIFGIKNSLSYNPHISLMYGNYPEGIKENIIKELGNIEASFIIHAIRLVNTEGTIVDWKTVKEFPI